jgi:hypothetical protein
MGNGLRESKLMPPDKSVKIKEVGGSDLQLLVPAVTVSQAREERSLISDFRTDKVSESVKRYITFP